MSDYLEPGENQDNNRTKKSSGSGKDQNKATLEKKGPNQDQNFKVLKKDGSLADGHYNNEPGGGALEGTVGIGT
jgi:hypothetical protein